MALALVRVAARFAERLQGCAEIRDAMAARQHTPANALLPAAARSLGANH